MKVVLKPVLWSMLSLLMLCLFAVPGLNVIAMLLMFVPITVLYTIANKKIFVGCIVIVLLLASIIVDPVLMLFLGVVALIPSIILGHMYETNKPSTRIIPYLTAIVLLVFMISLLVLDRVFSFSLINQFKSLFELGDPNLVKLMTSSFGIKEITPMFLNLIPLGIAMMAFFLVICSHYVARRIVGAYGINIKPFPEAKDWNLPRRLVFIYFIANFTQLIMDVTNTGFFTLAILNIVPALSFAFTIQAVGLVFYLGDHKKWPKIVSIIIAVPVLLFPLSSILGVIDVAFNLRKRITKK